MSDVTEKPSKKTETKNDNVSRAEVEQNFRDLLAGGQYGLFLRGDKLKMVQEGNYALLANTLLNAAVELTKAQDAFFNKKGK